MALIAGNATPTSGSVQLVLLAKKALTALRSQLRRVHELFTLAHSDVEAQPGRI